MMTKIQKYGFALQIISFVFLITMFIIVVAKWFFDLSISSSWLFPDLHFRAAYACDYLGWVAQLPAIPLLNRLLGFIVDMIGIGIFCSGTVFFYRLMKCFRAEEFFSQNVIGLLGALSRIALCWAIYSPIRYTLLSVISTFHKEAGSRILAVQVSTTDIINIFIFIGFVLITTLVKEGSKIKQEQDFTV